MLKKIVNIWARLTAPHDDIIAEALGLKNRPDFFDDFFDRVSNMADRNIDLSQQLRAAQTRASKNGCLALLAFGLIGVEIMGVALYFLPK
jgi:hypothetical protein